MQDNISQFIEDSGITFELIGLPRMAGRILGFLMISDPKHQSTQQIGEALAASKGSISTNTRLLLQYRLIEKKTFPAERITYFQVTNNAYSELIRIHMHEITLLKNLAQEGLEIVTTKSNIEPERMNKLESIYNFFESEYPSLVIQWEQENLPSQGD
jgi:DNA-binding transcriptional regulator GbsR (MarR family)